MNDVARRLAPIEISDAAGNPVVLGTAWSERPLVLVFIRHFG